MSELDKFLVGELSTCHMTRHDSDLLLKRIQNPAAYVQDPIVVHETGYGWLVYVCDLEKEQQRQAEMVELGFSQMFIDRCVQAAQEGCKLINFDCDGPEHDDLPKEQW